MGVFIACWLPFFVTNLLSAFCQSCIHNPERVVTVVTWLGWINSGMNPVIYACWSRDFRRYSKILCTLTAVPLSPLPHCFCSNDEAHENSTKSSSKFSGLICAKISRRKTHFESRRFHYETTSGRDVHRVGVRLQFRNIMKDQESG
jgi:hypothetical protein